MQTRADTAKSSPILSELRVFRPAFIWIFFFSFFTTALYLAGPLYMEQLMDRVSYSRSTNTLAALAMAATFLIAMFCCLDLVRRLILARISVAMDERFSRIFFDALHRGKAASRLSGSTASLTDFNTVRDFLCGGFILNVFDALWSPLFILVLILTHWIYGLMAIGFIALSVALAALNHVLVREASGHNQRAAARALEFGGAVSRNAEALRGLGMLPALKDRWYDLHRAMLGWQSYMALRTESVATVVKFMRTGQMVFVYTVGMLLFLTGESSLAGMIIVLMLMTRGIGPIEYVVANWRSYGQFKGALSRLDDILRDGEDRGQRLKVADLRGPLTVSRAFVTPPNGDKLVLNDVSFTVPQGRILGVVGPNGAGKSCLARVMVGIWSPQRGSVAIGDHDLAHVDEDELGRAVGFMSQDVELLPGTVLENIARFDPVAATDPTRAIAAAELAGIQDLVRALPKGYNTLVGPGGHVLSGGQRHRLALARAVYGEPGLVVLDEPNANFDALGEQALVTLMQRLQEAGTTVVVVTHKVSLLNYCDDILVLNAGTVQAFGSREVIANRIPRFRTQPQLTVIDGPAGARR